MVGLGLLLSAENARAGAPDTRVGLVLLERTLLDPPRLSAMQRWSEVVRRRYPAATLLPYVWHLVSHAREDGLRQRSARRPAGEEHEFGGLQNNDAVRHAWDVTRLCVQASGGQRVVLRTGASVTPGALGRKRIREFVQARRDEGIDVVWEPEGLWEPDVAQEFARQLGVTLLYGAFEGGRPRYEREGDDVLVGAHAWLRADGAGPSRRLDGAQLDALAMHVEALPDTTVIFAGPRAPAHLSAFSQLLGS